MSALLSIVQPLGSYASTCGYCGVDGERSEQATNCMASSLMPYQLSCDVYQKMIDRGWRRSGTYCYKPDLRRSCCPQYTIKLDAVAFKPSKSHRKLLSRWNRYVLGSDQGKSIRGNAVRKGLDSAPFELTQSIHVSERQYVINGEPAHNFEVTLELSSFTEEKFALYQSYEKNIHHKDDKQRASFTSFLVDSPLHRESIPYPKPPPSHLPRYYGAYHQLYRLDGELVAMGVIDILPSCVSSVYFMWEKRFEKFSLGKLSALREASLAREMYDAGIVGLSSLYMGFYIQSCQKMRYKGEYFPSYLADPEDFSWHPIEVCRPLLEKYRYATFIYPEHSNADSAGSPVHHQSVVDQPIPSQENLDQILALKSIRGKEAITVPINSTREWRMADTRRDILSTINGLGIDLSKEVIFYLQ